jgi:hypothetical protein
LRTYDAVAGDPLATDVPQRVQASHLAYIHMPRKKGRRPLPAYLRAGHGLPRNVVKHIARLRLPPHLSTVEAARQVRPMLPHEQRLCASCAACKIALSTLKMSYMLRPHAAAVHTCVKMLAFLTVQKGRPLMQEHDFKTVALYIHKCVSIADQAASSAVVVSADTQLANNAFPSKHDA